MSITITTEQMAPQTLVGGTIFSNPAFRRILAREFRLEAVQVVLETDGQTRTIPAFRRHGLFGKQTLVLGAGFDKTGVIADIAASDYSLVIEQLLHELASTRVDSLEIRTAQHIPCLTDESDKVELNVDIQPSVDAVWNGLSTNTRKNIRRPLKLGFTSVIGLNAQVAG